jgi:hypothetical protein
VGCNLLSQQGDTTRFVSRETRWSVRDLNPVSPERTQVHCIGCSTLIRLSLLHYEYRFGRVGEISKSDLLASSCLSAGNSLAPTGRIFMKFDVRGLFRKSLEEIQVSLKSDKNSGYFTWRPAYIYDTISLNSSYNEKYFGKKSWRKSKHILCLITFFPPKIVPFVRQCGQIWWSQTDHRWQYNNGACALRAV